MAVGALDVLMAPVVRNPLPRLHGLGLPRTHARHLRRAVVRLTRDVLMDRGTRPVLRGIARETVRLLTPQVRDVARDLHDLATDTRELGLPATFIVSIA
jgi:hypothetical protein